MRTTRESFQRTAPDPALRLLEQRAEPTSAPVAVPEPCVFVLFGATGDLASSELLPALFELAMRGLLPERFAVLGSGRRAHWSNEEFRERMRGAVERHPGFREDQWRRFARMLHYVTMDASAPADSEEWRRFAARLGGLRDEMDLPGNALFHLAIPPDVFPVVAGRLAAIGESRAEDGWRKLVVEKPFGTDEASAVALDRMLLEHFEEDAVYRVDHFLGKETVQNMLVTRFANPNFEPVWDRRYVDHVQITASEAEGIGTRGSFYEETGVIRDMLQNHLLQLLCFVAADPPVRCFGTSLRDETARVLAAVRPPDPERDLVIGQYGAGRVDGRAVRGYLDEEHVETGSSIATFVALRLTLDSWRWAGVPFYLRTGKRLTRKRTEVSVHFEATPQAMFPDQEDFRSTIAFRLQPDEAVEQTIAARRPGPVLGIEPVRMRFTYADAFGLDSPPRSYAWLLYDALMGDPTLFARSDWIRRSWALIDPLVDYAESPGGRLRVYEAGSWGPREADRLIERDGRRWHVR